MLVVATLVLAYVTLTLKRATDHLARVQARPKLVLGAPILRNQLGGTQISITNKGLGGAFKIRLKLVTDTGTAATFHPSPELSALRPGETLHLPLPGVATGKDITFIAECEDIDRSPYSEEIFYGAFTSEGGAAEPGKRL